MRKEVSLEIVIAIKDFVLKKEIIVLLENMNRLKRGNYMELIDREELKKILCDQCAEIAGICQRGSCGATRMLDSMPAVDAVRVIRCKDCVHRSKLDNWCAVIGGYANNYEWYCASGWNGMKITDEH